MGQLSAGAASSDITPPAGVRLSGFAGRPTGNTGCRDPIRSSALYLAEGGRQAVILSVDIIGFHPEDDRRLRLELAARLGMDPDAVMTVCTHTHAGPATMNLRATGDIEPAWLETVIVRSIEAAVRARDEAVPVVASHGAGYSFANINRRLPTGNGVALAPFPGGPCDSLCRVLLLESDEIPVAVLVQYEMHPVMLGNGNLQVSADWVGHLRDKMESALDCPVIFLQGCCGDVNPRLRGDDGACEALGLDVAGSALTALRRLHPLTEPRLSWAVRDAAVPVTPVPDDGELAAVESAAIEKIRTLSGAPASLSALH
ncbi:MAG: hypothetical protein LC772_11755, partial [Chloroflexi bacterium]|nr:hypothetical protein [Chloroflexota bacterium]